MEVLLSWSVSTANGGLSRISHQTRLFYVICTRAQDGLAVIAYTANPEKLRKRLLQDQWFLKEEVIEI